MTADTVIEDAIIELIGRKSPIGWYGIEHGLRVPRSEFPGQTNVMTFLKKLEAEGRITRDAAGKYILASAELGSDLS